MVVRQRVRCLQPLPEFVPPQTTVAHEQQWPWYGNATTGSTRPREGDFENTEPESAPLLGPHQLLAPSPELACEPGVVRLRRRPGLDALLVVSACKPLELRRRGQHDAR